jgi:arginine deiminase
MIPSEAEQDLYNDIIPLPSVLAEFTQLKKFLELVSDVYELKDLLEDTLKTESGKQSFLEQLAACFPVWSVMDDLLALPARDLAESIVRGIPSPSTSFARLLDKGSYISRPLPNTYFMRDSAAVIGDCALSAATAFDVRMTEAVITRFIFTNHPDFKARDLLFDGPAERSRYVTSEGGDIIVISPDVFAIGLSERTTPFAVERIARNASRILGRPITFFAVNLPKTRATIHLDMVFTMIDKGLALVFEPVILGSRRSDVFRIEATPGGKLTYSSCDSLLRGLELAGLDIAPILCAKGKPVWQEREQWLSGANSFAFAPGKILMYSCNGYTAEALSDSGFAIVPSKAFISGAESVENYPKLAVTFDGIELARGGGGARCMTLPVEREPVL